MKKFLLSSFLSSATVVVPVVGATAVAAPAVSARKPLLINAELRDHKGTLLHDYVITAQERECAKVESSTKTDESKLSLCFREERAGVVELSVDYSTNTNGVRRSGNGQTSLARGDTWSLASDAADPTGIVINFKVK